MGHQRSRYLLTLGFLIAILAGVSLSGYAISGRYVDVDIEAFHGWGFLGLGTWNGIEPRLVSLRIEPLPADDAGRVGIDYAFYRDYSIVPSLGDPYRVVLTNRTDGLLGIVLAIDGLNTNGDAKVTGTDADRKWILLPYAYLPSPGNGSFEKGTGAGELTDQPTIRIPFRSASHVPLEVISIGYGRGKIGLGFTCAEVEGAGIMVGDVIPGTIADLRGLRAGDVITYANAAAVNSCSDLQAILAARSPGDRVVVKVHREGRAFLLMLEIEE